MLKAGIVGLPNVGKSTLFNALSNNENAEAANYPFCTIEPNTATVIVPDSRLQILQGIVNTQKVVPAIIEFVDIAGLVKGASQGEGLGNKFLSNIKETDLIVHVVRCFEDPNVVHVAGKVSPIDDIMLINTELAISDLDLVERSKEKYSKKLRSGDKEIQLIDKAFDKILPFLKEGKPAKLADLTDDERFAIKSYGLLTLKKVIYAANVAEADIAKESNEYVDQVKKVAQDENSGLVVISANAEAQLIGLSEEEKEEFLTELGVKEMGLKKLIKEVYQLLGLQTYFTAGEKEARAWTINIGDKAPRAASKIHTDFERGFIKAEVISYDDFVAVEGRVNARTQGKARDEGKEYVVSDGDVIEFKFNV
ncbi:MAG: redox-regulated ATPase YchF [Candidatus Caenarcaniphilales bacterium]|nr:redox-regulated ATPase YchF [Candidatus Caenarcaniphilales bacterium]